MFNGTEFVFNMITIYIYIYQMLLSKATYSCIQVINFLSVFVFPGNRTHNLLRC